MLSLDNLKSQNIHIVGLSGTEGAQLAKFLHAKGCDQHTVHDFCEEQDWRENFLMFHGALDIEERKNYFSEIAALPIVKNFGKDKYLDGIEQADIIFVSQGWYLYKPNQKLFKLKDSGKPFYTILNLYFALCQSSGAKTIGITGSNGKTTTSRLIYQIVKVHSEQNNCRVEYVGNDRNAVQDLFAVEALTADDFLVLEISNRQLKLIDGVSPNIAVITNITENHLNEHADFQDYVDQKLKVWKWQTEGDFAIVNMDDNVSRQKIDKIKNKQTVIDFSCVDSSEILSSLDIRIPGKHNQENILAAYFASQAAGVSEDLIKESIATFKGVSKRLEFMDEVNGVKYYNDLSSTTPISTIAAIKTFEKESITLIIGGDDKGVDYQSLADEIIHSVDNVILMEGSTASESLAPLIKRIPQTPFIKRASTALEAFQIAAKVTQSGGVVLLSPAGEGFFSKYLNRRTGGMSLKRILTEIAR